MYCLNWLNYWMKQLSRIEVCKKKMIFFENPPKTASPSQFMCRKWPKKRKDSLIRSTATTKRSNECWPRTMKWLFKSKKQWTSYPELSLTNLSIPFRAVWLWRSLRERLPQNTSPLNLWQVHAFERIHQDIYDELLYQNFVWVWRKQWHFRAAWDFMFNCKWVLNSSEGWTYFLSRTRAASTS